MPCPPPFLSLCFSPKLNQVVIPSPDLPATRNGFPFPFLFPCCFFLFSSGKKEGAGLLEREGSLPPGRRSAALFFLAPHPSSLPPQLSVFSRSHSPSRRNRWITLLWTWFFSFFTYQPLSLLIFVSFIRNCSPYKVSPLLFFLSFL